MSDNDRTIKLGLLKAQDEARAALEEARKG